MKYTTKIKQPQVVGKTRIEPNGGDLNADQVSEIKNDPYGRDLIRKGYLNIEGVKPDDVKDDPKKGSGKKDASKKTDAPTVSVSTQTTAEKK
ncbi:MAG: hypothetical protein LBU82_06685 [Treponema sp.]|jgi:hypothetical protein|nr:hypothetical protein [Treponema sp.]